MKKILFICIAILFAVSCNKGSQENEQNPPATEDPGTPPTMAPTMAMAVITDVSLLNNLVMLGSYIRPFTVDFMLTYKF